MKASRFVLASVGTLGLAWILLIALSGKESQAQGTPVPPEAPPATPASPPAAAPTPPEIDSDLLPPVAPTPADAGPPALPDSPDSLTPAQAENIRQHSLRRSGATRSLKPVAAMAPPTSTAENDPEKAAQEFVEKNQKVAETQLTALTKEAEALRSRLQKVESAIRRWESVAHALKQSEGVASRADGSWKAEPSSRRPNFDLSLPTADEAPTSLEPIARPKPIKSVSPPTVPGASPPVSATVPGSDVLPLPKD